MAVDCSNVPTNAINDCENPWGPDCSSQAGFQMTNLWSYTKHIQGACANDSRLFLGGKSFASAENASLTQESCRAIAGSGWTYYSSPDIWNRLTTWKFPLLQLVASFPRPPLSFAVEFLVILHLLGDPVDTIRNLLAKICACQRMAEHWKKQCQVLLEPANHNDTDGDRNWKALAIMTDAYGEWSEGDAAQTALSNALTSLGDDTQAKNNLMTIVRRTGRALAADRSTKFLPIIVAQVFFIAAVGIAIFRTKSSAGNPALSDTVFINIEAHSIAFSALYFWIIPAVFLSSVIGVSQTEAAIPRILRRFQIDLDRLSLPTTIEMPNRCLENEQKRVFFGGVYSWQPSKWQSGRSATLHDPHSSNQPVAVDASYEALNQHSSSSKRPASTNSSKVAHKLWSRLSLRNHVVFSHMILLLGSITGMIVSSCVPPDGFNCRHIGEVLVCLAWILSAQADKMMVSMWPVNGTKLGALFWTATLKDLLATIATMGGIVITQVGVFNQCACYTQWGRTGLALPERPDLAATLLRRLSTTYPAVTFTCIGIELILVPLFICLEYPEAIRVYTQRDDRKSNAAWFWKAQRKLLAATHRAQRFFSQRPRRRSKPPRRETFAVEQGEMDESIEMRTLTHTIFEEPQELQAEGADAPEAQPDPSISLSSITQSESSGVDPPSRSGTLIAPIPEPRRRDPQSSSNSSHPSSPPISSQ